MTDERHKKALEHSQSGLEKAKKGDVDGALEDLSLAIHLDPDRAEAFLNRGTLRRRRRDFKGAISDLTEVLRLNPQHDGAFAKRGACYLELFDYDGAVNDFTRAIALNPNRLSLFAYRARTYLKQKDGWNALDDSAAILNADPKNPDGTFLKGLALELLNDEEGAEREIRQAKSLGHWEAREVLKKRFGG